MAVERDGYEELTQAVVCPATRRDSRSQFARRAGLLYAGLFIPLVLNLPTTVIIARGLGPMDKGLWSVLLQGMSLAELACSLGAGAYYVVALSGGRSLSDVYATCLTQSLVVPLVLIAAIAAIGTEGRLPSSSRDGVFLSMVAASLVLLVLSRQCNFLAIGVERSGAFTAGLIGQSISQFVVVGLMATTLGITLRTAVLSFLLGVVVRFLVPCGYLLIARRPRIRIDAGLLVRSVSFGWKRAIAEVQDALMSRLPLIIVALVAPLTTVGVYSVSLGILDILGQAGIAFSLAGLREMSRAMDDPAGPLLRFASLLGLAFALVGLPLCLLVTPLFGHAYAHAAVYLLVLLPTVPVVTLARTLASALSARGDVSTVALASVLAVCTIALLGSLLARAGGANGASGALLTGLLVQTVILARRQSLRDNVPMRQLIVPQFQDVRRAYSACRLMVAG